MKTRIPVLAFALISILVTFQHCGNPVQHAKKLTGSSRNQLPTDDSDSPTDDRDGSTGGGTSGGGEFTGGSSAGTTSGTSGGSGENPPPNEPPPQEEWDCTGPSYDPGWSNDEWRDYFFGLISDHHLGAPTQENLRSIQDEIEHYGARLQHNSANELRGRIYLPTADPCNQWGRPVDVVTGWGESWTWIIR